MSIMRQEIKSNISTVSQRINFKLFAHYAHFHINLKSLKNVKSTSLNRPKIAFVKSNTCRYYGTGVPDIQIKDVISPLFLNIFISNFLNIMHTSIYNALVNSSTIHVGVMGQVFQLRDIQIIKLNYLHKLHHLIDKKMHLLVVVQSM